MTIEELRELMELKGWNETILAGHLKMTPAAILKWIQRKAVPDGPPTLLLRIWLAEARAAAGKKEVAAK